MFDVKIYKIVGGILAVSTCGEGNKKNFKNCDFCFQLPSLLVEFGTMYKYYLITYSEKGSGKMPSLSNWIAACMVMKERYCDHDRRKIPLSAS